jgi:hypothetical protein
MKKSKSLLILIFSLFFSGNGYAYLSPKAKISLITVSPGSDLYNTFGHSAFWVYDSLNNIDRVYNYGTFNFSDPNFYMKFTRGKLDYMLSVSEMQYLLLGAYEENRSVIEQVLNLSWQQKENLFIFLEKNYLPENRYYKYDFFYDNCSTRLRDALKAVCGDSLQFTLVSVEPLSFRQLINIYLTDKKFQDLGMDIGLGAPADRIASPWNEMFLPEFLMNAFAQASLKNTPLVGQTSVLYKASAVKESGSFFTPAALLWFILVAGVLVTLKNFRKTTDKFSGDALLFFFTGLLGFLLLFLWFATDHKVTVNNWDLWWALPLHVPVALMLLKKWKPRFLAWYFLIYGSSLLVLLLSWSVIPEELNTAIIPVLLFLSLRSGYLFYKFKFYTNLRGRWN